MTGAETDHEPDVGELAATVHALTQAVEAMRGELRDALQTTDLRAAVTRSEARLTSRLDDVTQIAQTLKADFAAYAAITSGTARR